MTLPETQPEKFDRAHRSTHFSGSADRLSGHFHAPPKIYFACLLTESLAVTGASAGQIWALNEIGQLARIGSTDPQRFQAFENTDVVRRHRSLLSEVLFTGKRSTTTFRDAAQNGRERLIFLAPMTLENEPVGVVELILDRPLDDGRSAELQTILTNASGYLSYRATHVDAGPRNDRYHSSRTSSAEAATDETLGPESELKKRFSNTDDTHSIPTDQNSIEPDMSQAIDGRDVEEFVLLLHNQSDLDYVASTSVNEARRLLGCDRVWLATMAGAICKINAISGQDDIARNANAVRALQKLAQHVIQTGQEVNFGADCQPTAESLFDCIAEYLDTSGVTCLTAVPLFTPERIDFDASLHVADKTAFAALVVEQFSDRPVPSAQSIQRLSSHISLATWHALKLDELFLVAVRRRIGRWLQMAKLTRAKGLLAIGAIALFASVLAFVKAPYHVAATGRLMPVKQFRAYAPFDGHVQDVWVDSGEAVQPHQQLVNVHSETLMSRALLVASSIAEKEKILSAYKAQLDDQLVQHAPLDRISLSAKIAQYAIEISGLKEQLELTNRLIGRSQVKSPIAGTVATFQPGDLLSGRPVARGELLLEVMDENGPWQIELQVPEKRLGHLLPRNPSRQRELRVTFVPAASPENTYHATISRTSNRVSSYDNEPPSMLVLAHIKPDPTLQRTIGVQVTARIQCDEQSLGYVWFGDIYDWARAWFW